MRTISKEYLIAENGRLARLNTMLLQYMHDVENNVAPTAIAVEVGLNGDVTTGKLYRPRGGEGGLAVMIYENGSDTSVRIQSLDILHEGLKKNFNPAVLPEKLVVAKLVLERDKLNPHHPWSEPDVRATAARNYE